jgi:AraC-like DNA-binding protein
MKKMDNDVFVPKIFYCIYRKCSPDWWLRPHSVDCYDITYIVKGNARYTINGKIYELGPGDILFLTDGDVKEAVTYSSKLMHCYSVNFSALYPEIKCPPLSFPTVSNIGIRRDLIDLFREMTISWTEQRTGYIMKTRAQLMLILHRLSEILIYSVDNMTGDDRVNKITRFITLHYSKKLTVKDLSEMVSLHSVYLGHLFKQQTGMTIYQYIMQIRVRNAESMLQSGNYKVHEVAELCGFSDIYHFYKSFRAIRGFAPSKCKPRK